MHIAFYLYDMVRESFRGENIKTQRRREFAQGHRADRWLEPRREAVSNIYTLYRIEHINMTLSQREDQEVILSKSC